MEKGRQAHDVNLPETGSANYLVLGPYDVLLQCSCVSELVHRNLRLPRWALPGIENQSCVSTTRTKTLNSDFSVLKLYLSPVFMFFSQVFINIFPMLIPMVCPSPVAEAPGLPRRCPASARRRAVAAAPMARKRRGCRRPRRR